MKSLLIIFCLFLLSFLLPSINCIAQTSTPPASGDGTSETPYEIATLENLYWLSQNSTHWDKCYKQMSNINASSSSTWDSGEGWSPIGNSANRFTGTYDGNGFTISNLTINRPTEFYQGFFGYAENSVIINLGLTNVYVSGDNDVGGLLGHFTSGTLSDCSSYGSVLGNNETGGLIGYVGSGTISNCYSINDIDGNEILGGLVGFITSGTIENCYTSGTFNGTDNIGGIVGWNISAKILNCYNTGQVYGNDYVGGILGTNMGGTIDTCYNTGIVSGTSDVGGIVGFNNSTASNCFWDTITSGISTGVGYGSSSGVTGESTSKMKTYATFFDAGWDMVYETTNGSNDYWGINASINNGYPYLSWQAYMPTASTLAVSDIGTTTATGNGDITDLGIPDPTDHGICWSTSPNPTIADSHTSEGAVSAVGTFTSSITALEICTTYYVRAYATNVIGTAYGNEVQFSTTPDGTGTEVYPYLISNLNELAWIMNNASQWDKNYLQTANIDATATSTWDSGKGWTPIGNNATKFTGSYNGNDFTIDGLTIDRDTSNYQGLFGYVKDGTIEKARITNAAIQGKNNVGGLAGWCNSATINNCCCTGAVSGTNLIVGGLIGGIDSSSVVNYCYSDATVSGASLIGGFAGGTDHSSTIEFSYSTGAVSGTSYIGGFIGGNNDLCEVNEVYSTGHITGSNYAGGLVGTNNGTVTNCFWDTETSGTSTGIGKGTLTGASGEITSDMKTQTTYSSFGWDFSTVWRIEGIINNGYPFLRSFSSISNDLQVSSTTITGGVNDCFNAYNTIEVAGDGTIVEIQSSASAYFIAEVSIRFLPGFHACTGSYSHAFITTTGSFCDDLPESIVAVQQLKQKSANLINESCDISFTCQPLLKVYPNPNNGKFTVGLSNVDETVHIKVFNSTGSLVYQTFSHGESNDIDISCSKQGIFFVWVNIGQKHLTQKILIQQ